MSSPFGVSKGDLGNIVAQYKSKDLEPLEAAGGLKGLEKALNTNLKTGLSAEQVAAIEERKQFLGANVYPSIPPKGFFFLWFEALKDTTLLILMAAALISLILGLSVGDINHDWIEGTAILIAVFIVSIVTAANNFFKERQFRKLNDVKNDKTIRVMRDGVDNTTKIGDIVVGDVVILTTGCQIPADGLMIHGEELCADESVMTGEPEPPHKNEEDPFLLSGTQIAQGIGTMLVLAVGPDSEWGKTMAKLQEPQEETPLQQKLDKTAGTIGKIGLTVAIFVFVLLTIWWIVDITKEPWKSSNLKRLADILIIAVTIVVVAIPEGLPLAVTISLAYSVREMMNDQNLVRHLSACETMGGATNICSDKTGTLTENRMSVRKGWVGRKTFDKDTETPVDISKSMQALLYDGIAVNSTAQVTKGDKGEVKYIGAPTECALLVLAQEQGRDYNEIRVKYESVKFRTYPFSSEKKRMSTVIKTDDGYRIFTKGAAEMILTLCDRYVSGKAEVNEMTDEIRKELLAQIDTYAGEALRNIAMAYNDISESEAPKDWTDAPDKGLIFVGLVGILDPVRATVPDAVKQCQDAGIIVRMVTGDNLKTAIAIAKRCGILKEWGIAMEGPDFAKLSYEQIDDILPRLQVLARSSPTDKYVLVTRLRHNGEVVSVTGDGTNDAPALKASDVGLAMGIAGTEVAKEASDIIIMDDNFTSISRAVLWGRSVYDNIRKFLTFQLTINITALAVAFVGAVTGRGTPLTAVQLLWVNLIMDTFAALALATEKPTRDLMSRKPYGRNSALLSPIMLRDMFIGALFQCCGLFTILYAGHLIWEVGPENEPHHYCMLFNTFVLTQFFNLFNARKIAGEYNVFSGLHKNLFFVVILFIIAAGQALIVEFGYDFTSTRPLDVKQWFSCIGLAFLIVPLGFVIRLIPMPKTKEELAPNPNKPAEYAGKSSLQGLP